MTETELLISRIGFPPFSARNCHQTLTPIVSGEFRRTVNGKLCYLGRDTHHKFQSVIVCEDKAACAFDRLWCGAEVDVSCVQRLWQEATVEQASVQLLCPAVMETILVQDKSDALLPFQQETPSSLIIKADLGTKVLIGYCPLLKMRVIHFSFSTHEWSGKSNWTLELEEV